MFRFKDEYGTEKSLGDLKGKKVILFFYPKDLTPGCTAQNCNLSENYKLLTQSGFVIIGVSADTEKTHQKFKDKYKLPFTLIADVNLDLIKTYGVYGPKQFMGKKYMGIHRTTFIIDENGIIEHIIEKVDTKNHTEQILKLITH
jgi:peroxiredoxin Q/BCP